MLDQLQVDVKPEPKEESEAGGVPLETTVLVVAPELVKVSEERQESVTTNGEFALAAAELLTLPGPSAESQERVQPPDLTSTIAHSQADAATALVAEAEKEQRPADILDQVPLTDRPVPTDSPGPLKPPRQFTVEPDIVASTKKPPPTRPPPPGGGPPPRPPPPSCHSLPSRMSQECVRPSGLEGEELLDDSSKTEVKTLTHHDVEAVLSVLQTKGLKLGFWFV